MFSHLLIFNEQYYIMLFINSLAFHLLHTFEVIPIFLPTFSIFKFIY